MGIHLIIYVDNMLVLVETREKAEEHAEALVYLLQCLNLIIN